MNHTLTHLSLLQHPDSPHFHIPHPDPPHCFSTPWLIWLHIPQPAPPHFFYPGPSHFHMQHPAPPHFHSTPWSTLFSLSNLAHLTSTYHTLIHLPLLQRPKPLHFHIPHPDPPQSLSTPWPTSLPCATPWSNFLSIPDQSLFIQRPYSPRFRSTTHERGELLVYFPIQESVEGILCLPGSIIAQIGNVNSREVTALKEAQLATYSKSITTWGSSLKKIHHRAPVLGNRG